MNVSLKRIQSFLLEEEIDENKLRLDTELVTSALKEFYKAREHRDLQKDLMN